MTVSIPADVNVDGTVNIFDAIPLAEAHGSTVKRSNLESKRCLNGDGIVDVFDTVILVSHLGHL
jgi:hypothetical protein